MRFSSTTLTVLFGLVAAAVAAPMAGDAASDLYVRDFDADVFERGVYGSVRSRSENIDVQIQFVGSFGTSDAAAELAKKEDAMKIVEFVTRSVFPALQLRKNGQPTVLGEVTASNNPLNSLGDLHWKFKIGHGGKCGGFCKGFASAVAGDGGINAVRKAHVMTSKNVVLWEKKAS